MIWKGALSGALFFVLSLTAESPARAAEPVINADQEEITCTNAAAFAEHEAGIPTGLLLAIGRIESGRADYKTGRVEPWPWTTNVAGMGRFFASKQEAVQFVRDEQSQGVRSIDTGCFQVNLYYHPQAFSSPEDAFDPVSNARYAAKFLTDLYHRTGSWEAAVAAYHSVIPAEGGWYRDRVLASWKGGGVTVAPRYRAAFAARPLMADPHIIMISSAAQSVQVWGPGGLISGRSNRNSRLPKVIE